MIFKKQALMIFLFALVCPVTLFAGEHDGKDIKSIYVNEENSLLFDENTPKFDKFPFDIDEAKRLKPEANDFELVQYAPMSNKIGERWVLITVKNTSSGHRFLRSEHIVATFTNEEQANPIDLKESVDPGEIFSKTIFFGIKKFPVLMLEIQP
jgi:hypothetical protein